VRKKIISALTYPAVLVFLAICLVVVLMTFVIPSFSEFYVQFEQELPLITKIVMATASTVKENLLLEAIAAVALIVGFRIWKTTPSGRWLLDSLKLRVPLMGHLVQLFALSQFSRSMAVLLGGGTPMVPALETASTSVNNVFISERFLACVSEVQEGRALSEAMEATKRVPDLALAMMRVGESTGALPEMLNHTSAFFDDEIDFILNRIVTLFEPAILVVMGLVVAGLLLAVYYPLLTLVANLG
jgi:type IV pilus assembly protein PilC